MAKDLSDEDKKTLFTNIKAACETGWDFSSRWMTDPKDLATMKTIEILPIDLNSLMYNIEKYLSELYLLNGDTDNATLYLEKAESR